ncbi:MAG: aminoacyl-tRNA hydrolase [Myxococcales bacterium]|nr:aminoacyl-tRNA hydrolase [Myxococcales bacterium]
MTDLFITPKIVIPASELAWSATRSGGPGGQNVNKVSTKVDLRFDLAGSTALSDETKARVAQLARLDADGRVLITSERTRSQPQNLEDAREKLRELIQRALVVPKRRRPTKPSKGAQRRRLESKTRQSAKKATRGRVDW